MSVTDGDIARPDPFAIEPARGPIGGVARVPGSKSITNRALVCAALAGGTSIVDGVLVADDTEAMLDCLTHLGFGVDIDRPAGRVTLAGAPLLADEPTRPGRRMVPKPHALLDARLSGTTARFIAPLLLLADGEFRLDGGPPLRDRPMGGVFHAMRELGAVIDPLGAPDHLPVIIRSDADNRRGGPVAVGAAESSQFASGLLLVAPGFESGLAIRLEGDVVSRPYLELTLAVMAAFGVEVEHDVDRPADYLVAAADYHPTHFVVEPDASAASYFFAAAAMTGGCVRVEGLGSRSVQGDLAFVDVLARMGAQVTQTDEWTEVRGTGVLHGITVDMADLSDTAQTLAAVAVFADSPTEVTGIGFIRRKETDRIAAVVTELQRCRIDAAETADGFVIVPGEPTPAVVSTYDDHRMAMSFALLGLRAPGIEIADPGCVAKTFPGYWDELDRLREGSPRADRVPDQ
jgi:3-phosphoshikimate 1-carboxyvinyltransferase